MKRITKEKVKIALKAIGLVGFSNLIMNAIRYDAMELITYAIMIALIGGIAGGIRAVMNNLNGPYTFVDKGKMYKATPKSGYTAILGGMLITHGLAYFEYKYMIIKSLMSLPEHPFSTRELVIAYAIVFLMDVVTAVLFVLVAKKLKVDISTVHVVECTETLKEEL